MRRWIVGGCRPSLTSKCECSWRQHADLEGESTSLSQGAEYRERVSRALNTFRIATTSPSVSSSIDQPNSPASKDTISTTNESERAWMNRMEHEAALLCQCPEHLVAVTAMESMVHAQKINIAIHRYFRVQGHRISTRGDRRALPLSAPPGYLERSARLLENRIRGCR